MTENEGIVVTALTKTALQYIEELDSLKKLYNDLLESHAKQVIENRDLKSVNNQWAKLLDPIIEWGQSGESRIGLGESITSNVLEMAKDHKRLESELLKAKDRITELESNSPECVNGYDGEDLKFCDIRNGEGGKCYWCNGSLNKK